MVNSKGKPARPKSRSALDLESLASEWDSDPTIRTRLREKGPILHPESGAGEDINTCVLNKELLVPLIFRMSTLQGKPLPGIHDLHAAIEGVLTLNQRPPKAEDYDIIIAAAWRIRFLLGFLKMKCRRHEVSKVPCLLHCQVLSPGVSSGLHTQQISLYRVCSYITFCPNMVELVVMTSNCCTLKWPLVG